MHNMSSLGSLSQYPCLSVHQRAAAGKWANSQLTIEQSFFIGPGFRNFIFSSSLHTTTFIKRLGELKKTERS